MLSVSPFSFAAEPPTPKHPFPAAGTQGTTVSVKVGGKIDPWPPKVWVDAPGITFKPAAGKNQFDVEIAKDAAPGPHFFRVYNEAGASAPRFFVVTTEPELADKEPNDTFKAPQKIEKLPATISGKLDKSEDVDSFAITLKKGEAITASLEGYVLMSTFDGLLRVVDERGTQLGFNHDGRTLDPSLTWTAPRDGTFIVQVMGFVYPATSDVRLTGGDGCVYRLHLLIKPPAGSPTSPAAEPPTLTLPGEISGCIDRSDAEDRFDFTAVKQRAYEFALVAAREGSSLDGWLRIDNKDGKQLARADDSDGSRDPKLVWTAPSDGVFTIVVGDVTHRGGASYTYRLKADEAVPKAAGTVANDSFVVKADKPAEAKVTVKRTNGYKAKLKLAAKNLPEGVSAAEVEVPEKDGEVTLKLTATPEAKAASQPMQIVLREGDGGAEHIARFFLTVTGENNGVPEGYRELVLDSTDQLWLTVIAAPPKPAEPKPEPPKTEAAK